MESKVTVIEIPDDLKQFVFQVGIIPKTDKPALIQVSVAVNLELLIENP